MKKGKSNQKGFTIIESIIALVMVSLMAAMLYSFSQPLYNSAGAFGLFNDELIMQQNMERILADYKSQINDQNNPFDPGVFRQYVIQQYPMVNAGNTGFLTFTGAGTTYTAAWPPQANIPPVSTPAVLIVTLQRNERILSMIFTWRNI